MFKKNQLKPAEIDWKQLKRKKLNTAGNFEDIMSKFLKDSEERHTRRKKASRI